MKKIFLLFSLFLLVFGANSKAQDLGIEKLYYPTEAYGSYELSSYFPIYYQIKNFGNDSIVNKIFTLELLAEGTSPKFTQFRASVPGDWTAPVDDRKAGFYENGFHNLVGMNSVMGLITPEHAPGDTIHICLVATVEGDTDPSNDTLCFYITLKERPNRDLALHILSPEMDAEVHPNHTTTYELSIRNDGEIAYDYDSVFGQMAIEKGGKTLDIVSFAMAIDEEIAVGDSASIMLDIPLAKDFPTGEFFMGFRMAWLSEDKVFELGESNLNNNIRYVRLNSTTSSINDARWLDINVLQGPNSLLVKGNFESGINLNTKLLNLNGQEVLSQKNGVNSNIPIVIPTSSLPKGAYLLLIESNEGGAFTEKVILK